MAANMAQYEKKTHVTKLHYAEFGWSNLDSYRAEWEQRRKRKVFPITLEGGHGR